MEATKNMSLIDITTLKQQLSIEGITTELSDEDLQLLLNNLIKELMGYSNIPINPVTRKTIIREFSSDILELDYYPVTSITSLKIANTNLSTDDYVLDEALGILYFNLPLTGMLVVEYVNQISEDVIDTAINPLLFDMVKYRLTNDFESTGVMSSVKEGDVQVNYDTSTSLGSLINNRINNLKSIYSIKIRML